MLVVPEEMWVEVNGQVVTVVSVITVVVTSFGGKVETPGAVVVPGTPGAVVVVPGTPGAVVVVPGTPGAVVVVPGTPGAVVVVPGTSEVVVCPGVVVFWV